MTADKAVDKPIPSDASKSQPAPSERRRIKGRDLYAPVIFVLFSLAVITAGSVWGFAMFSATFASGAAAIAVYMYVKLTWEKSKRSSVQDLGVCPDTHLARGESCVKDERPLRVRGLPYVISDDSDRALCLDDACATRMGAIEDMGKLDGSQISRLCSMFRKSPFARLTQLDGRCPRS